MKRIKVPLPLLFIPLIAALAINGCLTGPDSSTASGPPWALCDSAFKVVENLRYAYNHMDLDLYMSCFREDFVFHILDYGWPYFDPSEDTDPDSSWGYSKEMHYHRSMFSAVHDIDLQMTGDVQSPWTGDSTGESLQLLRSFDLKVYPTEWQFEGIRASGDAMFICRRDGTGEWYIWQWWDQSET